MAEKPASAPFSPGTIHTMTVKNRIVMPPMGTAHATLAAAATDRLIHYYAVRARRVYHRAGAVDRIKEVDGRHRAETNSAGDGEPGLGEVWDSSQMH
ncbi:MAG TPA: hypothetical protein VEH09_01995 [Thermodesulfobacteriota bacterium]|nr:hypothetical protein [Thermodesulfobacteriota bacterium]